MNDSPPDVSTGFLAFLAFALLGLALWFLMRNMNARMRRMSYRQQRAHRGRNDPQAGPDEVDDELRAEDGDGTPGHDAGSGDSGGGDGGD